MNRLDYFLNNEENYKRLGIPHTLGLLFHGEPGCGKTSTIKAIANNTRRHVVEIPLSKIKTCSELKRIFFNELINSHYVPSQRKIIVLEDIDCMGNIVHKRTEKESTESVEKIIDGSIDAKKLDLYEKLIDGVNDDKLTLSYILNLIDGVLEQPGRIMIITTNHPDKLDKALLRPGRIDMKIHFGKCSKRTCSEILELYFNKKLDETSMPDHLLTPAEVFELCFNINDLDGILNRFNCLSNSSTPSLQNDHKQDQQNV